MPQIRVKVSSDGKMVTGLYNDKIPYKHVGHVEVQRASDVFFNEQDQTWRIKILSTGEVLDIGFGSRELAIQYEVMYLQKYDKSPFEA